MIANFSLKENYNTGAVTDPAADQAARQTVATAQLTVSGNRYVYVGFTKSTLQSSMSAAATDATLRIYLLRDTTDIAFFDLRVDSGSDGPDVSRHVGSFFVLDRPSAGTYTYKCEAIRDLTAGAGSATISFYLSPLFIAKEFIF